tara:strand:- start:342 stop:605 length:264 start_codon:yes stop_codon:yes gene_type:complete
MATQAELDKEQDRIKSLSGTIGKIDLGAGVYDLNTRLDDNKEGVDERIQNDGIDSIEGSGGVGTFKLDVVKDDNTAGRASFTGDGII